MFAKYKFELTIDENTEPAFPVYNSDLAIEFEKESNEQFFRRKLSGKLTFQNADYQRIVSAAFDAQFLIKIYRSNDAGGSWAEYWEGDFYKTDCEFNTDTETVVVTPKVIDDYTNILAGLEREFNLIELAPEIVPITIDKRPMIQIYTAGETSIGCFLSGMWWEQECERVDANETIEVEGEDVNKLIDYLHFARLTSTRFVVLSGQEDLPEPFIEYNAIDGNTFDIINGIWHIIANISTHPDPEEPYDYWTINVYKNGVQMWYLDWPDNQGPQGDEWWLELIPVQPSLGRIRVTNSLRKIYGRTILDKAQGTFEIPADDIVSDHRNYHYCTPFTLSQTIVFSGNVSETPTQWGLRNPGEYFSPPNNDYLYYPIARSAWGFVSIWFAPLAYEIVYEQQMRAQFVLNDAYPFESVISVLLGKIAPGITFERDEEYSRFFFADGITPIFNRDRLFITPKSNVITSGYDQPAQKAPITLRMVLTMLRDCFRVFWFIDADKRLRLEHIKYFKNGGSYDSMPRVGVDLTTEKVTRNGKTWAFGQDIYTFDKPEMTGVYQFGWMDDVTDVFNGPQIDIISNYVDKGRIENINVANFTSDIDYILLNPGDINKDGFVLLSARLTDGVYKPAYYAKQIKNVTLYLQNGLLSFTYLQTFYVYDMPAPKYEIDGVEHEAVGTRRLKTSNVRFPSFLDPSVFAFIKTNLGNGMIEKISVNLSSRTAQATLKYDTE